MTIYTNLEQWILSKVNTAKWGPKFIQHFAQNWPRYSLRGLHIRITWFSLYGIHIPLFSLYAMAAMDSPLSQGLLLWGHNDMTVIVWGNTRGRERDTRQRRDNANARRLQTVNR